MRNKITLSKIELQNNRITYRYNVEGDWVKLFTLSQEFFVEYSQNMELCPKSIAVLPFLGTILVLSWLFDAEIILEEIDADFYHALEDLKEEYTFMYERFSFQGDLTAKRIVSNSIEKGLGKSLVLYSGGVDANYSLYNNIDDSPSLLTLWGADIGLGDTDGWNLVAEHTKKVANRFSLEYGLVKTSFRKIIKPSIINGILARPSYLNYWYTFHHGMGIVTHAAPYAYLNNIRNIMISASYCFKELKRSFCASDPALDSAIRFCGCKTIHEGYEAERVTKIRRLCKYSKQSGTPMNFRVCWETKTGNNCCLCMKCSRTWLTILTEGYLPEDFGFLWMMLP